MKASILTIGDEILIGQIIDTNSAWIGQQLNLIGVELKEILSVSDEQEHIISGLDRATEQSDIVLLTGGLGPTKDDITKKVLATFLGDEMMFNQEVYDHINGYFAQRGRQMTELHEQQCYLPESAICIANNLGTAPGMWFEKNGKIIISMPGVPYEMKYIMENGVLPKIKGLLDNNKHIIHKTILTAGQGESLISQSVEKISSEFPDYLKLAFLPGKGQVRLRITGMHEDREKLEKEINRQAKLMVEELGDLVFGYGKTTLSEAVGKLYNEKNKTISTAESCTGGKVAASLVSTPGSSAYFKGSMVAYAYELKESALNVNPQTLINHGAVSEETVKGMLKGALTLMNTDVAVAISGIAGPGGGTPEKPVGTIWMACGDKDTIVTKKYQLNKDRQNNIDYTVVMALNMLRLFLMESEIA